MDAPDCYKNNKMKDAKTLLDGLKKEIEKHIKQTRETALKQVATLHERLKEMKEYSALTKEQKSQIENSFTTIENYIQDETLISSIRDQVGRYSTSEYNQLLTQITEWTKKETEKPVEFISQSDLGVKFDKPYLASEEDVDGYLDVLKKALLKAIKNNKRIRL